MIVPAVGGRLRVLRPQFFFPQLNLKHCVNEQPRADAKRTLFDEEQRRITLEKYIENNFEGRTTKRKKKINDSSNNTIVRGFLFIDTIYCVVREQRRNTATGGSSLLSA